jgi:hypothetical protein
MCPEFVQRGLSLSLARDFDLRPGLFHKVFNSSVENFHEEFIAIFQLSENVAHELRWLVKSRRPHLFSAA